MKPTASLPLIVGLLLSVVPASAGQADTVPGPIARAEQGEAFRLSPDGRSQVALDTRQPVSTLSELSLRVEPGEEVSVRTTSGEEVVGRFSGSSASSLTVAVEGRAREIPADDVERVVLRRGRNRFVRGLLIGAPLGAFLGGSGCYSVDTSTSGSGSSCGAPVSAGLALGAGIGAWIGSKKWRPAVVFPRFRHRR
jgi:hypothetical protein